jgi:hypothetical protein
MPKVVEKSSFAALASYGNYRYWYFRRSRRAVSRLIKEAGAPRPRGYEVNWSSDGRANLIVEQELAAIRNGVVHGIHLGRSEHCAYLENQEIADRFAELHGCVEIEHIRPLTIKASQPTKAWLDSNTDLLTCELHRLSPAWMYFTFDDSDSPDSFESQSANADIGTLPRKGIPFGTNDDFLKAEFIQSADAVSECWVEVAEGIRIRTAIPNSDLSTLALSTGDSFRWSSSRHIATEMEDENVRVETERLAAEIRELNREFREELTFPDTDLLENK